MVTSVCAHVHVSTWDTYMLEFEVNQTSRARMCVHTHAHTRTKALYYTLPSFNYINLGWTTVLCGVFAVVAFHARFTCEEMYVSGRMECMRQGSVQEGMYRETYQHAHILRCAHYRRPLVCICQACRSNNHDTHTRQLRFDICPLPTGSNRSAFSCVHA